MRITEGQEARRTTVVFGSAATCSRAVPVVVGRAPLNPAPAEPQDKLASMPMTARNKDHTPFMRKAAVLVAIAFELPGAIMGGLLIGYFLDGYFNTSPWLLMLMPILAFTGACIRLVRWRKILARTNSQGDDRSESKHDTQV